MTDIFDRATKAEEEDRADAISLQQFKREQEIQHHQRVVEQLGHEVTHCGACGIEIPAKRRKAVPNCTRCADCQRDVEVRNKIMNR
ncbi:TraR/DksA C4-type zinc finger protein [Herbaspirillum sp. ST 5-3]|uniref:TraR/DksA C4-type zinc finger protein n=1 Tax=Oxalobacteraceae TaxID=75682 RepID=UPI001B3B98EB|nr:TraR/DksA C4-type zinc finger protein [Herbaspirillum sp. ST 5-3]